MIKDLEIDGLRKREQILIEENKKLKTKAGIEYIKAFDVHNLTKYMRDNLFLKIQLNSYEKQIADLKRIVKNLNKDLK